MTTSVSPAPRPRPVVTALAVFTAVAFAASIVVALFSEPDRRDYPFLSGAAWFDGWFHFDSGWYYGIVQDGYFYIPGQQSSIAFFPTYPMVVKAVTALAGNVQVAGTLVTLLSGAAAAALFALWTSRRLPADATRTSVVMLLLYPYTFFLIGTMYADAMFLLTVIGSFVLLERGHPWLAGLVGALATAGRPVGIAVAVGLVVRLLEIRATARRADSVDTGTRTSSETSIQTGSGAGAVTTAEATRSRPLVTLRELADAIRSLRLRDAGVLLSATGFAGWCVYLWTSFGNPLAFVAAEESPGWDQGSGPRTWFKIALLGQILHGRPDVVATLVVQALLCLAAVLLLRRVWRRFGWGYLAYCLVVLAIPLIGTKDFMGTGRYLLAAFPVMAAGGDLLTTSRHSRWLRPLVLSIFAVGLVAGTALYARGYEVS